MNRGTGEPGKHNAKSLGGNSTMSVTASSPAYNAMPANPGAPIVSSFGERVAVEMQDRGYESDDVIRYAKTGTDLTPEERASVLEAGEKWKAQQ